MNHVISVRPQSGEVLDSESWDSLLEPFNPDEEEVNQNLKAGNTELEEEGGNKEMGDDIESVNEGR